MPMIVVQPAMTPAMTAESPTAPVPKTASVLPAGARSASSTPPAPVWMPHPNGAATSSGIESGSVTTLRSLGHGVGREARLPEEVRVDQLAVARERARAVGPRRGEVVRPEVVAVRRAGRVRQVGQWPQESKLMPTRSPGATSVTPEPTRLDDARALVAEHGGQRHRIPLVAA